MIPDCIVLDPDIAALFMMAGLFFIVAGLIGFFWTVANLTDPDRKR